MMRMKAKVFVTLKRTVLDPQGKTITKALQDQGHANVADVRQGKYFEIGLAEGLTAEKARAEIEQIARDVLCNPVIEEFSYQIE